ncbi:putative oxidoreductase YdgJ [Planctomycetes bacterium Poly30]|uniref:Putative oxidoreductase YdgJ n=1 Tax=Saltatorellus ferox TaxID=2528018 RepID=A0A518ENT6_9BACT|nr:putative oxidoreductase YdgJ [Planctomycetes bacterium Poly30]
MAKTNLLPPTSGAAATIARPVASPVASPGDTRQTPRTAPLGIGVVGAGYWGPKLIRNFQASADACVRGVCDRDPARLASVGQGDPTIGLHTELEGLLDDPSIEAIAIATPVDTHFELAKRVLMSGRHVLIEKPIAASIEEAETLVALAEERGLTLLVDHTFLYHPAVEKMKELLDDGTLGAPLHFDSVRINLGLFQPDINVLWDLAPHDLSILSWLMPEPPVSVSATGASHWGKGTASVAYLSLAYPGNFIAHVHVSWLAPVKVRSVILSGTKRMMIYDDNQVLEKVKVYDRGIAESSAESSTESGSRDDEHRHRVDYRMGDMHAPHIAGDEALAKEVADFVRCVRTGETPRSNGQTALAVVRILEKAQESLMQGGAPVAV